MTDRQRSSSQNNLADIGLPSPFEYRRSITVEGGVGQVDADINPFRHESYLVGRGLVLRGLLAKSLRGRGRVGGSDSPGGKGQARI
jgi:hypothetical protein